MEIKPAKKPLKIFCHAMSGTGHLNACVGVAEALVKRGHSVLFLVDAAFKGQFAKFGFEELPMERPKKETDEAKKPPEDHVNPVKAFAKMILAMGLLNEKTPLERAKEMTEKRAKGEGDKDEQFVKSLYESSVDFNTQIKRAIEERKPDLFILDHFLVPPVLPQSGLPWLYLFSGNPIGIYGNVTTELPPFATGYPTDSDRALWEEYMLYQRANAGSFSKYQQELYAKFGYEPKADDLPIEDGGIFPQCKHGYITAYPKELDYHDLFAIPEKFIRMDAFCRETKPAEPFKLPEGFAQKGEKLIFFSLGSMGSVDTKLVQRVCNILSSKTPYKTIVSKGPLADEFELPERCWGEGFLPQTQILPMVDLVITHGGNNTVTETFSFGKPMIVLPLFGDQFDNAQRIHEKGFGRRLETYKFKDQELVDAVETLINDPQLKERLEKAAKRIVADRSKEVACMKIEAVVEKYAK